MAVITVLVLVPSSSLMWLSTSCCTTLALSICFRTDNFASNSSILRFLVASISSLASFSARSFLISFLSSLALMVSMSSSVMPPTLSPLFNVSNSSSSRAISSKSLLWLSMACKSDFLSLLVNFRVACIKRCAVLL